MHVKTTYMTITPRLYSLIGILPILLRSITRRDIYVICWLGGPYGEKL